MKPSNFIFIAVLALFAGLATSNKAEAGVRGKNFRHLAGLPMAEIDFHTDGRFNYYHFTGDVSGNYIELDLVLFSLIYGLGVDEGGVSVPISGYSIFNYEVFIPALNFIGVVDVNDPPD